MRSLLKFLLMPLLVATPAMSVVACGTNSSQTISVSDILNKAKGEFSLSNNIFNMSDLGLLKLPVGQQNQDTLNKILTLMQNKVTEGKSTWGFKTVNLSFLEKDTSTYNFIETANSGVIESYVTVNLKLELSGQSVITTAKIVVSNDKSTPEQIVQALSAYVKNNVLNNPKDIMLNSDNPLPVDGTKTVSSQSSSIISNFLLEQINLQGVGTISFTILPTTADTTIFNLNSQFNIDTTDPSSSTIEGTFTNLSIYINYSGLSENQVTSDAINVSSSNGITVKQTFSNVQSKISASFNSKVPVKYTTSADLSQVKTYGELTAKDTSLVTSIKNNIEKTISQSFSSLFTKSGTWSTDNIKDVTNTNIAATYDSKSNSVSVNVEFQFVLATVNSSPYFAPINFLVLVQHI